MTFRYRPPTFLDLFRRTKGSTPVSAEEVSLFNEIDKAFKVIYDALYTVEADLEGQSEFDANKTFAGGLTFNEAPTFTSGDTTPSVADGNMFVVNNLAATTIENFDDADNGKVIFLRFTNANTTINSATNILLAGGADFVSSAQDTMMLWRDGDVWRELGRSVNA